MRKVILLLLLILLFSFTPCYGATVYQWVDNNGTWHFTDDHEKIPLEYRNQVREKKMEDFPEMAPPALPSTPKALPQKEEVKKVKKDIFGLGEEWWRDKERPWDRQLREGSENYEAANQEFLNRSDNLILRKFGSHQQFKSTIIGMESIREERAKYDAKVAEAEKMLEKISREAEESQADPTWLRGVSTSGKRASLDNTGEIHGQDGAWLREKVLTQREQLEEAVGKYEKVYKEYSEQAAKLGRSRFGGLSLTQYQMISLRLDVLKNEMAKYRLQINEVTETLKKLPEERR